MYISHFHGDGEALELSAGEAAALAAAAVRVGAGAAAAGGGRHVQVRRTAQAEHLNSVVEKREKEVLFSSDHRGQMMRTLGATRG